MTHYKKHKLYKRSDGRWQIVITYKKQKYWAYGRTQKECCNNFDEIMNNIKQGKNSKQTITLFEWLDTYINLYKKDNKTALETARQINYHIKSSFKDVPLSKIDPIKIDELIANIETSRTRKAIYTIFHDALNIAYQKRLITENIADYITKVKHVSKEGHFLTDKELDLIFNSIKHKIVYNLFYFYLYTGTRKHEALNLTYNDLDFKNNQIHIKGTKTLLSDRIIPLFENLKSIFINNIENQNIKVFDISESTIAREIKNIIAKTGIHFSIKDFRTTFASACHKNGIDDYTIKYWLGHTSVTTTQKHYIKYDKTQSVEKAKLVSKIYNFDKSPLKID